MKRTTFATKLENILSSVSYQFLSFIIVLQERGSQVARIPVFWLTEHQHVVFHSLHFTILMSHHALYVAVAVEKQVKNHIHA